MERTSLFDHRQIPAISLTMEEIEDAKLKIADGLLPGDFFELHELAKAKATFGHDAKQDRAGNWIEQGIGSKGHETLNHFKSLKAAEDRGQEPAGTYDKAVAEIWKRDPERARKIGLPSGR